MLIAVAMAAIPPPPDRSTQAPTAAPKAFYRTPDVVYGTVVIVAVDGKVTVEVKEPDGMFGKVISTLPQLFSGGGGSAEQVTQAVTETFGLDVAVETVEITASNGGV